MSSWEYSDYRYERPTPLFEGIFRCLPFDTYKNPALEAGNKIVMPQSSIYHLYDLGVPHPWLFKIEGYRNAGGKTSHCGVLEFGAEEGCVYMPRWMMANLSVEEGGVVVVHDAPALSRGTYMKLQPHETAFVNLSNPRAVLETALMRGFSCLTSGDTIAVRCGERDFYLDVLEVGPGGPGAISLIDTDCSLDFAPPLDYEEPPAPAPARVEDVQMVHKVDDGGSTVAVGGGDQKEKPKKTFAPFTGVARRIDGTVVTAAAGCSGGELKKKKKDGGKEEKKIFKPFTGRGRITGGSFFDSTN